MELPSIFKCAIGLDVHQKQITACVIAERGDGTVVSEVKEFGGFKRDRRALVEWSNQWKPEVIVMESTGVYWKSPYAALERAGYIPLVVNSQHVKQVPGRKTDVNDSQWLATLAMCGLLRGSFIPPEKLRNLRLVARGRQKLKGTVASCKNRIGKILTDCGVCLGTVVSDIHGVSSRRMIECLIEGGKPEDAVELADPRLHSSREEIRESLENELTDTHVFLLKELLQQLDETEARISRYDEEIRRGLEEYKWAVNLLQTIPGVDEVGASFLVIEIGVDMERFHSASHLASWAGLCPGNNESAGKRRSGKTRKGNRYVRWLMCEIANSASRSKCKFQGKFNKLVANRGHKRTIFALAHEILKVVYVIIKRAVPFYDETVDYKHLLSMKKPPRWIEQLKRLGYNRSPITA